MVTMPHQLAGAQAPRFLGPEIAQPSLSQGLIPKNTVVGRFPGSQSILIPHINKWAPGVPTDRSSFVGCSSKFSNLG